MVTFAAGAGAYAPLAAAQVLFGPIGIMINAVQNVMRPELAAAIARGNRRGVMVASALSTGLLVLAVIVFGGLLALAWPWIEAALYAEKYQTQPMAAIALGCWAIALCRAVYTQPSSLLQAMRQFRPLALGTVGGAVLSTLGVAASLVFLTPAWSLAGVLAGESLFAVYAVRRAIAGFCRR
jgi:O-antigen/teichoic acid export membrane protein